MSATAFSSWSCQLIPELDDLGLMLNRPYRAVLGFWMLDAKSGCTSAEVAGPLLLLMILRRQHQRRHQTGATQSPARCGTWSLEALDTVR